MKLKAFLFLNSIISLLAITYASEAAVLSIGDMNITSGAFEVTDNSGSLIINPDSGSTITPFTFIGANTNLVGGYIGDNSGSNVIASTSWFGIDVSIYTAATNLGDTNTPSDTIAGGPVPTGLINDVAGTIEMDLSAWFSNWDGLDAHQGTGKEDGTTSLIATGTWDSLTGNYTLSWDSVVDPTVCGPFGPSCVAQWTIQGNASVVPVPPALWLFCSGLLGLIGMLRRNTFNYK